jgi:hypothetical protein
MLGLFGPKSDKIAVYKAAFAYQGPFRKDFSTGSPVINEVVLGPERAEKIVEAASMAFDDEEHDKRMWAVRSFLRKPVDDDAPMMEGLLAAELERLAPGVPALIERWCARDRREGGGAR